MSDRKQEDGAPAASRHRVTDASHEAGKPSSPSGSVPTGAASFTPGPWHVGEVGFVPIIFNEAGWAVADAKVYHGKHDNAESVANARLIAAAPELYEALQAMVTAFGAATAGDIAARNWIEDASKKAAAALTKARGGQS